MRRIGISIILIALICFSCNNQKGAVESELQIATADQNATDETVALMRNLLKYQNESMMFGHQDDLAYGIGWWAGEFNSDVQKVCGKYPAIFGWDAGEIGQERNIDSVLFTDMQRWIIEVFENGGINTLSWHLDNPLTDGDAWDITPAVSAIIPGGELHEEFKKKMDQLADFLEGLKTDEGIYVPIIFRPWHELNGSWFWWGKGNCSVEDYKALFQFTVEYLRDEKGIHHLLYSYSTDKFKSEEEYLERFPGADYVDLLGYDDYHSFSKLSNVKDGLNSLRILSRLGDEMGKPFALTETGLASTPIPEWWTDYILEPIKSDSLARKLSFLLVWRNARLDHHYAPFPGHVSAAAFKQFELDPFTWFMQDIPDFYSDNE